MAIILRLPPAGKLLHSQIAAFHRGFATAVEQRNPGLSIWRSIPENRESESANFDIPIPKDMAAESSSNNHLRFIQDRTRHILTSPGDDNGVCRRMEIDQTTMANSSFRSKYTRFSVRILPQKSRYRRHTTTMFDRFQHRPTRTQKAVQSIKANECTATEVSMVLSSAVSDVAGIVGVYAGQAEPGDRRSLPDGEAPRVPLDRAFVRYTPYLSSAVSDVAGIVGVYAGQAEPGDRRSLPDGEDPRVPLDRAFVRYTPYIQQLADSARSVEERIPSQLLLQQSTPGTRYFYHAVPQQMGTISRTSGYTGNNVGQNLLSTRQTTPEGGNNSPSMETGNLVATHSSQYIRPNYFGARCRTLSQSHRQRAGYRLSSHTPIRRSSIRTTGQQTNSTVALDFLCQQIASGGLTEGTRNIYTHAMRIWHEYHTANRILAQLPSYEYLHSFLQYCFYKGHHPDQVRQNEQRSTAPHTHRDNQFSSTDKGHRPSKITYLCGIRITRSQRSINRRFQPIGSIRNFVR
ncbi:hypothetical protein SARC_10682 [Sphaeroforma arctica JP610]|uniref:Core-binding (CB) domain-containing protein n=1 Tax=Sphaeroforma arctica JP610 TaxID=667725 RepID=A0A0L0FJ97_9EUKA|nr:hypothetical protein SARC_10682 [Sphaeroforma arctica JP610]KNC76840.1 hypothetical protein SARC_10682 [Sphaeroforma arctica JP610]|eukprot:XP_014150742.1 hypothetical protein SARC_10682 [Sphaeroforma arctica JP610]